MTTRTDILTPLQKDVLRTLFSDEWFRRHFYLTGGTALAAFYLGHRYSDDLDFFAHDLDLKPVPALMEDLGQTLSVKAEQVQKSPGFLRYFVEDLKIDFVVDVGFRVGTPELVQDYMVDNFKNIAVNKVSAILGRLDPKDYFDLYLILTRKSDGEGEKVLDIFELLELGSKKDAGLEPFLWASVIADVKSLTMTPRMILPVSLKEVQAFFLDLRNRILDRIRPRKK